MSVPVHRDSCYLLPPPQNPAVMQLQEKIEMETKIRDGATKLLQASSSTTLSTEASKGLFVSNAKIIALMREIQQLQTESAVGSEKKAPTSCPAKLAISGAVLSVSMVQTNTLNSPSLSPSLPLSLQRHPHSSGVAGV